MLTQAAFIKVFYKKYSKTKYFYKLHKLQTVYYFKMYFLCNISYYYQC